MHQPETINFLFIINPVSGSRGVDWPAAIDIFFSDLPHRVEKFFLPEHPTVDGIKDKINEIAPDRVIAVGGDGTVKFVAECLVHTPIVLGILPAGSANGLAKELGIPSDPQGALQHLLKTETQQIHLVKINNPVSYTHLQYTTGPFYLQGHRRKIQGPDICHLYQECQPGK